MASSQAGSGRKEGQCLVGARVSVWEALDGDSGYTQTWMPPVHGQHAPQGEGLTEVPWEILEHSVGSAYRILKLFCSLQPLSSISDSSVSLRAPGSTFTARLLTH